MAVKKRSKNNIANRGASAKVKYYQGKPVAPIKLIFGKKRFIAAKFENGQPVKDPAGNYIPYASIQ